MLLDGAWSPLGWLLLFWEFLCCLAVPSGVWQLSGSDSAGEHRVVLGASLDYFCGVAQLNQAFLAHTVPVDVSSPSPLSGCFGAVIWLFALRSAAFSVPTLPLPDAWPVLSEML